MPLSLAVLFISAGALAYEVLLMRLLSITQWYHFAYMIISLAMLGFGASGTFVSITRKWLGPRFLAAFIGNALLFSLAVVLSFATVQRIPLNLLEVLWDGKQSLYLIQVYLLLSLPFFFAANCIILTLARLKHQIHRIYLFDLLGAGLGACCVILLLSAFSPIACLRILSAVGFLAAGLAVLSKETRESFIAALAVLCCGCLVPFVWPDGWLALRVSEYKGLSMALRVPGASVVEERFSPLAYLAVVESPIIPFRYAPGLSLNCSLEPPPQLGVFSDGDAMSPITRYDGHKESLAYLDCLSSALPYHLLRHPRVLILGAGGGMDVLMAEYHQAERIDAVELDRQVVDLVQHTYGEFSGHIYAPENSRVHIAEARGFVARARERFDLIQVSLLDSFNASLAGGYALNETYLYTIEAFQEYLGHLEPGGFLAVTRWLRIPPRESLKLFATAVTALERSGVRAPGERLALIRSWKTTTLLVKNGDFSESEKQQIRSFCDSRSFDVDYLPGIQKSAANRYNILDEPYIYDSAQALLSDRREDFIRHYKFFIAPATDDRPYFFHFVKWATLPEILSLRKQGGLALIEWAYPILLVTLLQAFATSLVLILLPLRFLGPMPGPKRLRFRIGSYFLCLGLGFMFIEIAFIQKFILFLSHPIYSVAVVLCAFLIFAGLGSSLSGRCRCLIEGRGLTGAGIPMGLSVGGIVLISTLYLFFLPPIFEHLMFLPDAGRILISVALIAPLALFMGMPFPLGLTRVAETSENLIPWSWGINGCASVIGAVLATVLAIHLGFKMVIGLALVLYALATAALWRKLA